MYSRLTSVIAVSLVAVAGTATGVALGSTQRTHQPALTRVVHTGRYYGRGPGAVYGSDFGGLQVVDPLTFTMPSGASTYSGTITLSFEYRTAGLGRFVVTADLTKPDGGQVAEVPADRGLARSTGWSTATVTFRVHQLRPGRTYSLTPAVNLTRRSTKHPRASIGTRHLTVDLLAFPRG